MATAAALCRHALNRGSDTPSSAPLRTSRLIVVQGFIYLLTGVLLYAAPALASDLTFSPATKQKPEALGALRNVGLQVGIVGWFYIAGGRGRSTQLVAATIIAHGFVIPPLLMLAAWKGGLELGTAATFALTDLVFGNAAWWVYSQDLSRRKDRMS